MDIVEVAMKEVARITGKAFAERAATITALRARVAELEGALAFYADKKHWWTPNAGGMGYHQTGDGMMEQLGSRCGIVDHPKGFVHPQFYPDCGRRARAALRAKGGGNGDA